MIYSEDDWFDPDNSMADLEEEYSIIRGAIRDIVADIHEPEFEFSGLTTEEEPV